MHLQLIKPMLTKQAFIIVMNGVDGTPIQNPNTLPALGKAGWTARPFARRFTTQASAQAILDVLPARPYGYSIEPRTVNASVTTE